MLCIASLYDLKAAQMNVQCSLIREIIFYLFKQDHKVAEGAKNIDCIKGDAITRWFKKFRSDYNKLDNQPRSDRLKIVDSVAVLLAKLDK